MLGRALIGLLLIGAATLLGFFILALSLPQPYRAPGLSVVSVASTSVSAIAYAVVDITSGNILFSQAATSVLPIASVTKLMSAYAAHRQYDLAPTTTITWSDVAADGRAGSLVPGESLPTHLLLFPLLLESSNDAAAALERVLSEPPLVESMNTIAAASGLATMHFKDASGLSPLNVSSATDVAALLSTLYNTEGHLFDVTKSPSYYYREHGWINNNPLAGDAGFAGGKHGFTPEAGRTIAVVFMEDFGKGQALPVGYVVLGSNNLEADVRALRELVRVGVRYQ